jgi:hypothetical protein
MAHAGGRPPFYKTPAEMQIEIDNYFNDCQSRKKPSTIPGLAYFLGFESRFSLYDYAKNDEYSHTIARAKIRIEIERAETLVDPELKNSKGITFDLTNNFNWREKSEHEISGGLQVKRIELPEKVEIGSPIDL